MLRMVPSTSLFTPKAVGRLLFLQRYPIRRFSLHSPCLSASTQKPLQQNSTTPSDASEKPSNPKPKTPNQNKVKSVLQADAELRERLEQMSGEGGAAGIEYEDGQPVAMKRSVRNNMFRLI